MHFSDMYEQLSAHPNTAKDGFLTARRLAWPKDMYIGVCNNWNGNVWINEDLNYTFAPFFYMVLRGEITRVVPGWVPDAPMDVCADDWVLTLSGVREVVGIEQE
jgi:hypothetical protein